MTMDLSIFYIILKSLLVKKWCCMINES